MDDFEKFLKELIRIFSDIDKYGDFKINTGLDYDNIPKFLSNNVLKQTTEKDILIDQFIEDRYLKLYIVIHGIQQDDIELYFLSENELELELEINNDKDKNNDRIIPIITKEKIKNSVVKTSYKNGVLEFILPLKK